MKAEKPRKAVKGVLGQKMCGRPGTARSYRAKEYLQSEEKKKVKRKKKQKKKKYLHREQISFIQTVSLKISRCS